MCKKMRAVFQYVCLHHVQILQENNVLVKTIPIDASDPSETQEMVRSFLSSNKNIDGILALGPLGAIPIAKLLKEIDVQKKIKLATFDFTPQIIDGIMNGHILFALDAQQYLQGYLPVMLTFSQFRISCSVVLVLIAV